MTIFKRIMSCAIAGSVIISNTLFGSSLISIADQKENLVLGDINADDKINASDAAFVLIAAAQFGATGMSSLTNAQTVAADVNADGIVNATDAAQILTYSAYSGANNKHLTFQPYLYELNQIVKRVRVSPGSYASSNRKIYLFEDTDTFNQFFADEFIPLGIGGFSCYGVREDQESIAAELSRTYSDTFFLHHNLVAIVAWEPYTDTYHEIRGITTLNKEKVTVNMHTINDQGQPLSGAFIILIQVDESVVKPDQVILNETKEIVSAY